jgi:hypothetical protein
VRNGTRALAEIGPPGRRKNDEDRWMFEDLLLSLVLRRVHPQLAAHVAI